MRLFEAIERNMWHATEEMKKQLQKLYLNSKGIRRDANEMSKKECFSLVYSCLFRILNPNITRTAAQPKSAKFQRLSTIISSVDQ